jgi:4-alpha-glucanotransferase
MKKLTKTEDLGMSSRRSGILFHITSLPGRYGIGSLNRSAYAFVDFLKSAGQSIWQVLPVGPTGYGDSPYQSFSTFAGNPYLISLEALVEDGLLESKYLETAPEFDDEKVDYEAVYNWKLPLLRKLAAAHSAGKPQAAFAAFCKEHQFWLDDYALFVALKLHFEQKSWNTWPIEIRSREASAVAEYSKKLKVDIQTEKYLQFLFFKQWNAFKSYANRQGIDIFGDTPIFVALDSADSWVHSSLFHFDSKLQPKVVAGVPPDYFAPTGQLWGNPLYSWKAHKDTAYQWWIDRVRHAFKMFDILRIDHFRGFCGYWEVKAGSPTAESGRWVKGPGSDLFKALEKSLGKLAIVAEDLGDITPDVTELRDGLGLPGMKIVQFGFGSGPGNDFLIHNYGTNFVAYTGTHDNDTVRGWFESLKEGSEKQYFLDYFGHSAEPASRVMIRAALQSVADTAITPLQDLLDLDGAARMNFPGRSFDNWQWRLQPEQLTAVHQKDLFELTRLYGRLPVAKVG